MSRENYVVVEKDRIIRDILSRSIDVSELSYYNVVDFSNDEITSFDQATFTGILGAVNDPDILFVVDTRR